MNVSKAFSVMFKDPKWVTKMLWFSLFLFLCFFLVGIPFISGYYALMLQGFMKGEEKLPEWEGNWEKILMVGLKYLLVMFIIGTLVSVFMFLPNTFLSVLEVLFKKLDMEALILLVSLISYAVSFVINIVITILGFMSLIRLSQHESFSEVFDFDWYVSFFKKSWQNLLIAWLITIVFGSISGLGVIACCVGVFFTLFYAMVGNASILAEVAIAGGEGLKMKDEVKEAKEEAATPVEVNN